MIMAKFIHVNTEVLTNVLWEETFTHSGIDRVIVKYTHHIYQA